MEGRVGTAEFLTGDPIWVYGRGERPPSAGSHLRAAGQGVEEVKEHKAGESHRCGTWGACPVFRDRSFDMSMKNAKYLGMPNTPHKVLIVIPFRITGLKTI